MSKKTGLRKQVRKLIRNWAAPAGCGLFFLFLLKFVFFCGYVPSASMEPAIHKGSFIFGIRIFGELQRGEVVVFEHEGRLLVKRIAGVSGDVVYSGSGRMLVVPAGYYYMLGDNCSESSDSRYWDEPFVGRMQIIARVVVRKQHPY